MQQSSDVLSGLITHDPGYAECCRMIEKVAPSDATVLLLGELPAKEVLAQACTMPPSAKGRFVAINCAAIPKTCWRASSSAYEKARLRRRRQDHHRQDPQTANGGTLMLDEIGDLPMPLQAKLLRFPARAGGRARGGGRRSRSMRVVGATHQDLRQHQRWPVPRDLYYRLAEVVIDIPPLQRPRRRRGACCCHSFAHKFAADMRQKAPTLTDEAVSAIEAIAGPAMCASCRTLMKRAVIMCEEARITADLGLRVPAETVSRHRPGPARGAGRCRASDRAQRPCQGRWQHRAFSRAAGRQPAHALRPDESPADQVSAGGRLVLPCAVGEKRGLHGNWGRRAKLL